MTNRVLVEAAAFYYRGTTNWNLAGSHPRHDLRAGAVHGDSNYRSGDAAGERRYGSGPMAGLHSRAAGALHHRRPRVQGRLQRHQRRARASPTWCCMPLNYRFNNGVPNRITLYARRRRQRPVDLKSDIDANLGVYAQDKWTIGRLTPSYGLRYDYFKSSFPEQRGAAVAVRPDPQHRRSRTQGNLAWQDVTPRQRGLRPVRRRQDGTQGDAQQVPGGHGRRRTWSAAPIPPRTLVTTTLRTGRMRNGDFVPDCDLSNPDAAGHAAGRRRPVRRVRDATFGSVRARVDLRPGHADRVGQAWIRLGVRRPACSASCFRARRSRRGTTGGGSGTSWSPTIAR